MATCPRCLGALSDGHKCKPIWVKRMIRQAIAISVGGLLGGFVQILLDPTYIPAVGFVIGGLLAFAISEGMKE